MSRTDAAVHQAREKKETLRAKLGAARKAMLLSDVRALSRAITRAFLVLPEYAGAGRIALYSGVMNEVSTKELFEAAIKDGKEVFYPRTEKRGGITFCRVGSLDELVSGRYGIAEPAPGMPGIEASKLDCAVVPGLVFDELGARVGYGLGYYDAALKGADCIKAALAYDFQVVSEDIGLEPHDVRLDVIVTEKRVVRVAREF
ncbi:MAG: 5-formyltetrahydrofolate cyclo-ligase [Deltaproteobacteria bacterium]|nr:5-formyltetrahydrofolate cyclo-ligase [Deltaproteobacteria bacterium]